mgnify:CR=1 FL=1
MNDRTTAPLRWLHDMPADDYHAVDALSNSALSKLSTSPFHYWSEYLAPNRPKREPTPSMLAGTLAHCAVLEPGQLFNRYAVKPEGLDTRTKEGKAWAATVPGDCTVISAEQKATSDAQRAAVIAVPELASVLATGHAETSVFWTDSVEGLHCKCRPDWVHMLADGRAVLFDLKTTQDPSPREFAKSVWSYGYHRQAAHYTAGFEAATGIEVAAFLFGAVSSAYPFIAVPYLLDDDAMQRGREEVRRLLRLYAACCETDTWPAYGEGVQVLSLPAWAK